MPADFLKNDIKYLWLDIAKEIAHNREGECLFENWQ